MKILRKLKLQKFEIKKKYTLDQNMRVNLISSKFSFNAFIMLHKYLKPFV